MGKSHGLPIDGENHPHATEFHGFSGRPSEGDEMKNTLWLSYAGFLIKVVLGGISMRKFYELHTKTHRLR